jgi:Protein of unknown function (DUF4238)
MAQNVTRRQHVVSRFYLAGFADSNNQLVRVPLSGNKSHLVNVKDATIRKDFYSIDLGGDRLDDYFEQAFAEIEGPASTALAEVTRNNVWPLPGIHKTALAVWISLQYLRTEAQRNLLSELRALTIRIIVGASGRAALRDHIERAEGQIVNVARLEAEWADLLGPTSALLTDQQWSLNTFKRRVLATSDHPVSMFRHPTTPTHFGTGIFTAGGFGIALSRHCGLIIGASPDLPDLAVPGTTVMARAINAATAANARSAIYHHPLDGHVHNQINLQSPRTYEVDPDTGSTMIAEDGIFSGVSPEALQAMSTIGHPDGGRGMTLDDLEWPIRDRIFSGTRDL